jgi:transcriptional regulator with XRE-family HTH domain
LSQADLAARAGISPATISEIESAKRGTVRPSTLRKLADVLNVEVAAFFPPEEPGPKAESRPQLDELMQTDGRGWHEALKGITEDQRDVLLGEIAAEHARRWTEFKATDDAKRRAELEREGRTLLALEGLVRYGPSRIPVRQRERV